MSSGSNSVGIVALLVLVAGCATSPPPDIVPRAAWGWTEPGHRLPEHTVRKITVHHGGVTFDDDRDPAEYLRALQKWSRAEKQWMDIPYHYVIDLDGVIYEARPIEYPGDTNTSYDTRSHALIEVLGNYDERQLSETQFEALARLSAYLANRYSVSTGDIRGHRDYAPGETSCPGSSIYRRFEDGTLLQRVAELR